MASLPNLARICQRHQDVGHAYSPVRACHHVVCAQTYRTMATTAGCLAIAHHYRHVMTAICYAVKLLLSIYNLAGDSCQGRLTCYLRAKFGAPQFLSKVSTSS